jgi:hypothetical protein
MLLRLTPAMETAATEACAPLVALLDQLITHLPTGEHEAVTRFLGHVADAAEQHADRLPATPPLGRIAGFPSHSRRCGRSRMGQSGGQPRDRERFSLSPDRAVGVRGELRGRSSWAEIVVSHGRADGRDRSLDRGC